MSFIYRQMEASRLVLLIFALLTIVAGVVLGYQAGSNAGYRAGRATGWADGQTRFIAWSSDNGDWNGAAAQIEDAKIRWNRTLNQPDGREDTNRLPVVMSFPNRNCIKLKLRPRTLGREPIYCYQANTIQLIEEHSSVD